jgi:hypothetical protein
MTKTKTPRGSARAQRRINGGGYLMAAPSPAAQAAQRVDLQRANRKLAVALYHKAGAGLRL